MYHTNGKTHTTMKNKNSMMSQVFNPAITKALKDRENIKAEKGDKSKEVMALIKSQL